MIGTTTFGLLQAAPPAGGSNPMYSLLFQFGLIFLIFYFLIIRPQQKQRRSHEEALRNLKRGDRVVTAGGIVGDVIHIKEGSKDGKPAPGMDDEITIKSAESRFVNERGRIAKVILATGTSEAPPPNQVPAGRRGG